MKYDSRVTVWFNEKAYTNENIMLQWIMTFLIPALNPPFYGPCTVDEVQPVTGGRLNPSLITLEAAAFHKTDAVLQYLRAHDITTSLIPGGCTGLIQPLDVSINKPFKGYLRDVLDDEMDQLGSEALNDFDVENESAIAKQRILMTKAVGEAWERVR